MKKNIVIAFLFIIGLSPLCGQTEVAFTTVSEANGKVVFQQFVPAEQSLTANQKYSILQKWIKTKYTGSPLVTGIRFDDKNQSATVSAKSELNGVQGNPLMNYRFDISVANAGCVLVIRDITYQSSPGQGASFPKVVAAEQTITDQAVKVSGEEGQNRNNIRKSTLSYFNALYKEVSGLF